MQNVVEVVFELYFLENIMLNKKYYFNVDLLSKIKNDNEYQTSLQVLQNFNTK
jgi:hypothetical protein